jgi:hypothetical protein
MACPISALQDSSNAEGDCWAEAEFTQNELTALDAVKQARKNFRDVMSWLIRYPLGMVGQQKNSLHSASSQS